MLIDIYSKSNTSSRFALVASIVCIVAVGSYHWLLSPHLQYLEAAQRHVNEVSSYDKKSKVLEGKLKLKHLDADKLSKQLAAKRDLFFTPVEAQQTFTSLEAAAKKANCTIVSLKLLPDDTNAQKNPAPGVAGITISRATVSFVGSYPNSIRFLTSVLDCPGKIMINPFSIASSQSDSEKVECSLVITLCVMNKNNKGPDPNE
jgi:hypothetical protein